MTVPECKHRKEVADKTVCTSPCLITEETDLGLLNMCSRCVLYGIDDCYGDPRVKQRRNPNVSVKPKRNLHRTKRMRPINPNPTTPTATWSYGITTVPSRFNSEFKTTLESLKQAGFDQPTIFVDGPPGEADYESLNLPVVYRQSNVKTAGHWMLSAWELYIRNSHAQYFAMFQDDFITYKSLKQYIELSGPPIDGYLNLYTFPQNQKLADRAKTTGWFRSNQRGLGAVALVFTNQNFKQLISHQHMRDRFQSLEPARNNRLRRDTHLDGGIVDSFKKMGLFEYCHSPSLVQHIGDKTSMNSPKQMRAPKFNGPEFDALQLLPPEKRQQAERKPGQRTYELGDMVSSALSTVGITPERVSEWLGQPCGCAERKEKLNNLSRWAKQATKDSVANSKSFLKKLIGISDE